MRRLLRLLRLSPLLLVAGCFYRAGTSERIARDMQALPQNTILLSRMMQDLSAEPGFTEALLQQIDKGQKNGFAFTPELFNLFRKLVLGKNWEGLDRFPGWTIHRVTETVDAAQGLLKKESKPPTTDVMRVQVGNYPMDRPDTASLDKPSTLPGFSAQGLVESLGHGVVRGDGPDPEIAPMHAASERLAEVLNRLSLNGFVSPQGQHAAPFTVELKGHTATSPQELVAALQQTGHTVTVADARYFANFGHLHYKDQDVEMPFWLDTGLRVPPGHPWQRSRKYLIPVSHAEYEWLVSGPEVNANVAFYFGIDGRAEFRTNDQLNQAWVMKRFAHEYTGSDAVEVTELTGRLLQAYAYLHDKFPDLPLGGYYTLGVCQDVIAAIEQRMTGTTTIYPNTAQTKYFLDQPDKQVYELMSAIPKDTGGKVPAPERIFGSLPTTDFSKLTIPGLREDTERTFDAWKAGHLYRRRHLHEALIWGGVVIATGLVIRLALARRRRGNSAGQTVADVDN